MNFYLEFDTEKAEFDDHIRIVIPGVLRNVAQIVAFGGNRGTVKDGAGNRIGRWELDHKDEWAHGGTV